MNRPEDDAGGYNGDWSRGAPLGRPTLDGGFTVIDNAPPFILRKVRLNGDYDQGGAYWGSNSRGSILYYFEGPVSDISGYVREANREAAKAAVRELHPKARFYR